MGSGPLLMVASSYQFENLMRHGSAQPNPGLMALLTSQLTLRLPLILPLILPSFRALRLTLRLRRQYG